MMIIWNVEKNDSLFDFLQKIKNSVKLDTKKIDYLNFRNDLKSLQKLDIKNV